MPHSPRRRTSPSPSPSPGAESEDGQDPVWEVVPTYVEYIEKARKTTRPPGRSIKRWKRAGQQPSVRPYWEYSVKWLGYDVPTWEPERNVRPTAPKLFRRFWRHINPKEPKYPPKVHGYGLFYTFSATEDWMELQRASSEPNLHGVQEYVSREVFIEESEQEEAENLDSDSDNEDSSPIPYHELRHQTDLSGAHRSNPRPSDDFHYESEPDSGARDDPDDDSYEPSPTKKRRISEKGPTIRIPPLHTLKMITQRDPVTMAPIPYATPRKSGKRARIASDASDDDQSPRPSVPDSDTTIIGGDSDDSDSESEYEHEYLPDGLSPHIYEAKRKADEKERAARKARRMAEKGRLPRIEPPPPASQSASPQKRKRTGGKEVPIEPHTTLCDPEFQASNPLEKRIKAKARLGAGILDLFPATKGPNALNRTTEPIQVEEAADEEDSICPDSQEEDDIDTGFDTDEEDHPPSDQLQQTGGVQDEDRSGRVEFDEEIFGPAKGTSQCAAASEPTLDNTGSRSPDNLDEFSRSFQIGPGFLNQVNGGGIEI